MQTHKYPWFNGVMHRHTCEATSHRQVCLHWCGNTRKQRRKSSAGKGGEEGVLPKVEGWPEHGTNKAEGARKFLHYGLIFNLANLCVETLTCIATVLVGRAYQEVVGVKGDHKLRVLVQTDWCPFQQRRRY